MQRAAVSRSLCIVFQVLEKSESPNVHRIEHVLRDIRTSESNQQVKEIT